MATRGQVLDRVTDLLEDKTSTTRTRIEPWVGFVLSEMKLAGIIGPDATTTIALVADTATYNLPNDIDKLEVVYIEDNLGHPLIFKPRAEFARFLADDDDMTGTPVYYTLPVRNDGDSTPTIRFYPVPNAVETVRVDYKANFASLSLDADILELTDDSFTTAVWGVYRVFTRIEENNDIEHATEEFRLSIARSKFAQYNNPGRPYLVRYRDLG